MGSRRERSGVPLASRPPTTPVEVNLDALFPTDDHPGHTSDGAELVLHGWVVGVLHRWLRADTGAWIGVCTVLVPRTSGDSYRAVDQLVPAEALRRRT